jgi:hypothetical protein
VKEIDTYEFSRDIALLEQRDLFEKYKISYPLPTEDEILKILTEEGMLNRLIDEDTSSDARIVLIKKKRHYVVSTYFRNGHSTDEEHKTLEEAARDKLQRIIQSIGASRRLYGI